MKRSLNIKKLKQRKHIIISSEEALKDIIPIKWSSDVTDGSRKVTVCGCSKKR